ncbi:GtrA family protein [Salinicoccus hispanicus]|uniref:GtrA family protein n=1 Tax=Salinicoccus hispanicus TaxID=157225 RepID=A0A6N8TY06_9STAP|nr:GtrA family protein [Salinicoccus hispanicus]MXQ49867.1 GtrA family protein [Salinicoccus hispanicus]
MRSSITSEFARFVLVGLINTAVYYGVYTILVYTGLFYIAAHLGGFITAFIISYFLNCYFVYGVRPTLIKFLKFPLTQVINMGMQTLLLYVLVDQLGWNEILAPLPVLIVTVPITYGITRWVLKDKKG